jgi:flagellar biosynthesis protein
MKPPMRSVRALEAAALRHLPGVDGAPRVVAQGRGEVAERILALAREHGVPVHQDGDLLELLATCDLGDEIPPELYPVVAELLHFLYRLNGRVGDAASAPAA